MSGNNTPLSSYSLFNPQTLLAFSSYLTFSFVSRSERWVLEYSRGINVCTCLTNRGGYKEYPRFRRTLVALCPSGGPNTVITEGCHMDPRGPVAFQGSHYCDYRGVSHGPSWPCGLPEVPLLWLQGMSHRAFCNFWGSHYCDYRGVSHQPYCNFEPKEKV